MKVFSQHLIDAKIYFKNGNIRKALEKILLLEDHSDEGKLLKWTNLYFIYLSSGDLNKASEFFKKIKQKDISIFDRIKGFAVINILQTNGDCITREEIQKLLASPKGNNPDEINKILL